jgi:hypothetical protein
MCTSTSTSHSAAEASASPDARASSASLERTGVAVRAGVALRRLGTAVCGRERVWPDIAENGRMRCESPDIAESGRGRE